MLAADRISTCHNLGELFELPRESFLETFEVAGSPCRACDRFGLWVEPTRASHIGRIRPSLRLLLNKTGWQVPPILELIGQAGRECETASAHVRVQTGGVHDARTDLEVFNRCI